MKSYTEATKKHTPKEIAESLVFPGNNTKKQQEELLNDFRKIHKQVSKRQILKSKRKSKLLNLKFLMEDFLYSRDTNREFYFGYFLKEYINRIDRNSKEFAIEIDVNPTELSQIINRHRKPTDKLIYRLDIHSNKNFPAIIWFSVLEKERSLELTNDKSIIDSEKPFVKHKLEFSL